MSSELNCGSRVELLEFVRVLECLQLKIRLTVPFLIDTKIFYAMLKMSYGASYAPRRVNQILLGHPLIYGWWHPHKYSVEMTYKAFVPIVTFLEQGWEPKLRVVVPLKVKVRHMEKTFLLGCSLPLLPRPLGWIVPHRYSWTIIGGCLMSVLFLLFGTACTRCSRS